MILHASIYECPACDSIHPRAGAIEIDGRWQQLHGDVGMWGCGDGCFRFRDFANIVLIIFIRGVRVFFHVPVQSINDLSHLPKCFKYTYITLVTMVE